MFGVQWRIQDFLLGEASTRCGLRQPLTWTLFGENVCKNERIGPVGEGRLGAWIRHWSSSHIQNTDCNLRLYSGATSGILVFYHSALNLLPDRLSENTIHFI